MKEKKNTHNRNYKVLEPADPFAKAGSHFLANDDLVLQLGHSEINLQFYFFISFIAFHKPYVDNILTVHPEENTGIQFLIEIRQIFISDVFFAVFVYHIYQLIFRIDDHNVTGP